MRQGTQFEYGVPKHAFLDLEATDNVPDLGGWPEKCSGQISGQSWRNVESTVLTFQTPFTSTSTFLGATFLGATFLGP